MSEKEGLELKPPKTKWNKPVKIKLKLFKHLFNLVKDIVTENWLKVPGDVMDTWMGMELVTEPGEKGWKLVTRSLSGAMLKLVEEHIIRVNVKEVVTDDLDKNLNTLLEKESHFMGYDFFQRPKDLPLLQKVAPVYADFLECVGFKKVDAGNISRRLPGYFVLALMDEWRAHSDHYADLETYLKTPFDKAGLKEKDWMHYLAWLKKQVDEPVFDESFSLKQIYLPLRAYYIEKEKSKKDGREELPMGTGGEKIKRVVVDLEEELIQWLERGDKDDAFRVVAGGPGYGKSSFLKIFAAKLAEQHRRVLFIPLHRFKIKDDLKEAIRNFVEDDGYLKQNPLGEEPLNIIFDGLDELAMQGKVLAEAANHFIREIKMQLAGLNSRTTRLQVIISGRDIIIQTNESEFRKPKQIVHILPYIISINEMNKFIYKDSNKILKKDQRDAWWFNYGSITGKKYKGLPEHLKTEDLDKLTSHPLLNYLVALSFERGMIEFTQNTNLNEIYEDLLAGVYQRSYEEKRVHKSLEGFDYRHFIRILEEIAIAAWHGYSRTTTVDAIESHCISSGLEGLLETFKIGAKGGMVSFMAAFYFRRADRDILGNDTFEFTHKSFGEFLAAKRIVKKVWYIHKDRLKREENFDEGLGTRGCLAEWAKLFGPRGIDSDLLKFIINELNPTNEKEKINLEAVQETVIQLINQMLKTGMPIENLGGSRPPYFFENIKAINAEEALLVILNTIARFTNKVSRIEWPLSTSFGEWISKLQGQREGEESFILRFLNYLDIEGAVLYVKDLYGSNFQKSCLNYAQLSFANLRKANLTSAKLRGANLDSADLSYSNLKGTDFRDAILKGANLSEANLKYADLSGADLRYAILFGANLRDANLKNAKLDRKQLKNAIIAKTTKLP
jgi:hypothetical protein